ncbi:geraniol 8-hydroxylase-like [Macadamia integrifolia]|uniref:geraniol 8-hydroxylase-like n=1 Tax=Macadamia integrifolia TaxID=60698 RepID=UPI001C4F6A12|nr:geraniol 8-hydroxylase-like [Macadamia integrifolia]
MIVASVDLNAVFSWPRKIRIVFVHESDKTERFFQPVWNEIKKSELDGRMQGLVVSDMHPISGSFQPSDALDATLERIFYFSFASRPHRLTWDLIQILYLALSSEQWKCKNRGWKLMMEFFTLVLGLLLVLWSLRAWISALIPGTSHKRLPPGPVPLPIVGSLFELGNKPNESLARLAQTYGPLMTLKLGHVTTIVASTATMAKEILQTHDQALAGRMVLDVVRALNHHQASVVWLPPYSRWRNLRKLCNNQIFTSQRLNASESLRRQKIGELVAHVRESAQMGRSVDIGQFAFATSLNLLANTMFSVDLARPESETAQDFKALVRRIMEEVGKPNLSDYFPLLRPLDLQGIKHRMTIYVERLHKVFDEIINQRLISRASLPSPARYNDLLDVLLDQFQDSSSEFSRHDIKSLFVDILVAGTDTTSTTLEWAMAELLRNPDSMGKVQSELQEKVGEVKSVEESDVARLPYLQAVVKETFRLHPPAPLLVPHKAETEVDICGFTVPKDAQVLVNVWAIERDPSIWTNPDSFVPERFLESSEIDVRGRDFELIPFGAGRRICPGMPLALSMVHLMLASLLHSFDWKIEGGIGPNDMDMADKFGITLQKALPLRAIPLEATGS